MKMTKKSTELGKDVLVIVNGKQKTVIIKFVNYIRYIYEFNVEIL